MCFTQQTCYRISHRKCPTTVEWPFTVLSVSYSNNFLCYFLYDFLSCTLLMLLRKTAIITKYHENNLICNTVWKHGEQLFVWPVADNRFQDDHKEVAWWRPANQLLLLPRSAMNVTNCFNVTTEVKHFTKCDVSRSWIALKQTTTKSERYVLSYCSAFTVVLMGSFSSSRYSQPVMWLL